MIRHWWVSCRDFTVQVNTDENLVIIEAAPIVRKFVGQSLNALVKWKNCKVVEL
jgi:hypothetical protein